MILAGYFGEEVKDVLLDPHRWQRIYDDLVDVPTAEVIARESLRVFHFRKLNRAATEILDQREAKDFVSASGPTTGPRPSSWSSMVARDAGQASFTYAFQFGDRDLWKIGHATDLTGRLIDVNKHVPHEVLGEQWRLILQQPWPTEMDAYKMEQRVLEALRTASSVGERVACTQQTLERAWTSALVLKS